MSREPRSPTAEQLLEHTAFLTRLARQLVGDEHRAEDLVQDAYALALERPPREARSLRGWLAVVVSNLARNEHRGSERRLARERTRARDERLEPGELALETLEVQRGLIELVVALSEEQRTVLYLRYYADLTPSAIARRLSVPVKTVKARHTRALAELRARLDARSQGDRRAWMSALLPVTLQVPRARLRTTARGAQLALASAAVLVAVVAWSGRERTRTAAEDAEASPLAALEPAPTAGAARGASPEPAMETAPALREALPPSTASPEVPPPPAAELTVTLEVDRARAREVGWARADASDAQVVEAAAEVVDRRCRSLGRAAHLHVEAERGRIELALPATDPREGELLEAWLRDLGLCEFLVVADEASLAGLDLDLAAERQKLESWRAGHAELPLAAFHALAPAQGGPHPRLGWVRSAFGSTTGPELPVLLPASLADHFGPASFTRVFPTKDAFGYPCLTFDVSPARRSDVARITEARVGQRMAVVIGDQLRSAPTLDWKWLGMGSIEGRFSEEELLRLSESFRRLEGPLRIVETR